MKLYISPVTGIILLMMTGPALFMLPFLVGYYQSYQASHVQVIGRFDGYSQQTGFLGGTYYVVDVSGSTYTCSPSNFMSNADVIALTYAKVGDTISMTAACGGFEVISP